jgi:CRP-like cAMP-binding protein
MASCIVDKFGYYINLTEKEKELLSRFEDEKKTFKAGETIHSKGDEFDHLYVIYDGWTIVSSMLDKGLRSIFDIRIQGDFVGFSEMSFTKHLYDFHALTDVTVCPFPKDNLRILFDTAPRLRDVFFLILSREYAVSNERIVSIGRRTAIEKIAHLICEISLRFEMIGAQMRGAFEFPLRQDQIGDILGLTNVHVSRAMKELKKADFIDYNRSTMTIKNKERMLTLSNFNQDFLLQPFVKNGYTDLEKKAI